MNASIFAVANATTVERIPSPAVFAAQTCVAALTRVSLIHIKQCIDVYLRFGDPVCTIQLNRWQRIAVFLPGAVFCRICRQANGCGTVRWQLMVMQACTPLDVAQRIAGVSPGARLLLHVEGGPNVHAMLAQIDAIEALGTAPADVPPASWHTLGKRFAARLSLPEYIVKQSAFGRAGEAQS